MVVQDWPSAGMYWRSSSQMGHASGGAWEGGKAVPQVVQMNLFMFALQSCGPHNVFPHVFRVPKILYCEPDFRVCSGTRGKAMGRIGAASAPRSFSDPPMKAISQTLSRESSSR